MNLENELVLYQFAQGARPTDELLDRFSQLDTARQRKWFVHFYCWVCDYELTEADMEQALADCGLDTTDPLYDYLNLRHVASGTKNVIRIPPTANPPGGTLDKAYTVLLHLFRKGYYRRFVSEQTNLVDWIYQDLSDPALVQEILTNHRALVEAIYMNPSFRSEFASLAKLYYAEHRLADEAELREQEPPEPQATFDFVTYDELLTEKALATNKSWDAISLLSHSVSKGLSVHYGLELDKARSLMVAVIDKHAQETYHTKLFD